MWNVVVSISSCFSDELIVHHMKRSSGAYLHEKGLSKSLLMMEYEQHGRHPLLRNILKRDNTCLAFREAFPVMVEGKIVLSLKFLPKILEVCFIIYSIIVLIVCNNILQLNKPFCVMFKFCKTSNYNWLVTMA